MHLRRVADYRKKISQQKSTIESSYLATINSLAYAIEARDPSTRGHSERVATYAVWLAQSMGIARKKISLLQQCCRLHDVGKIGVCDKILLKPGKLTMEERAQIEMHPLYGIEILGDLGFIKQGLPVILHHHERFDGKGYPYGLKKEKISLEVRIVSVVDAFDAMSSDRPYRKALRFDEVLQQFRECSGSQFDPVVVREFMNLIERVNDRGRFIMRAA